MKDKDWEEGGGGTYQGEVEVGSTVKPSKDWRRPVPGEQPSFSPPQALVQQHLQSPAPEDLNNMENNSANLFQ
jgi:hypothetical protein